jgi:hypothetical protein
MTRDWWKTAWRLEEKRSRFLGGARPTRDTARATAATCQGVTYLCVTVLELGATNLRFDIQNLKSRFKKILIIHVELKSLAEKRVLGSSFPSFLNPRMEKQNVRK